MIPVAGLALGALLAILLKPAVPAELSRYAAMVVIAGVDASFGGLRAYLERTFSDRVFLLSFVFNAGAGAGLVWIGDQLGLDLVTAVVVVFGIRILQNLAALRRRVFGG